ncbi:MAG: hypothetical protein V3U45_03370, partial [bacterium]
HPRHSGGHLAQLTTEAGAGCVILLSTDSARRHYRQGHTKPDRSKNEVPTSYHHPPLKRAGAAAGEAPPR